MSNNASSNAAQLKSLPVPDLDRTLDTLHEVVSAVAPADQLSATEQAIAGFREGQGPELQKALQDFAADKDAENSSWLAGFWRDSYLSVREPLPLTTNVGFQVDLNASGTGLDRVARAIRRVAEIHLLQARGEMPEERDSRDNPLASSQWVCFNGGIRHPSENCDEFRRSTKGGANRTVGIIFRDRMWDIHISDASGHALSTTTIRAALAKIASAGERASQVGFSDMSYAGSGALAAPLAEILQNPENTATYQKLTDQLFVVSLDPKERTVEEHQRNATFAAGVAWVYKPITYVLSLADDYTAMHVEHSTVDGATLVTAVRRIQEVDVPHEAAGSEAAAQIEELAWRDTPELPVADQETPELRIVNVPKLPVEQMPLRFSVDAMAQFIMSIAQELTYGHIRAVYESVDMREYKAGRTECLRAITPEAVAFAKSIVAGGSAGDSDAAEVRKNLEAALLAHRNWVKACKFGNGIDRHLAGLGFIAEQQGEDIPLLSDPGVVAARTDFLSTTSIGSADQIIRYSFAPSVPHGFAVNYTPSESTIEYLVGYWPDSAENVTEFCANLVKAGELLKEHLLSH